LRLKSSLVAVARAPTSGYGELEWPVAAPELPRGEAVTTAMAAVREVLRLAGLDEDRFGRPDWNPLSEWIEPGSKVVLKPNWVSHRNEAGLGMECLVTHASVIEAVARYAWLAGPREIVIGDAPIQGCDFEQLMIDGGFAEMLRRLRQDGVAARIVDFRRTVLRGDKIGAFRERDRKSLDEFIEVDLGSNSLLEPMAHESGKFRVAMYNPDMMSRNHAPGIHRYLIARDVLEADTVISLPKLKTHKKAGVTGALKNLVGINGNKEYLPHYRVGGGGRAGDSYAEPSLWKKLAERLNDTANRCQDGTLNQRLLGRTAQLSLFAGIMLTGERSFEGSWWGNDTVWRMCLDLQRSLLYARTDGTLADTPQRRVVAITDAIVGGEGEGPLQSSPIASGFVTAGVSMPAMEWVHCRLMGLDPARIPLVRESFSTFRWPIAATMPECIEVRMAERILRAEEIWPFGDRGFTPAAGWANHCELREVAHKQ
jgi:uncharacterized protein (DUF362 family)